MRTKTGFTRPALANKLAHGGYDCVDSLRADLTRARFAQFLAEFEERVVHPVLSNNQTFVERNSGTTGDKVTETSVEGRIHMFRRREVDTNFSRGA